MNKLFQVRNKGSSQRLILAATEERAKEIAMIVKMAREVKNLSVKDITSEYINHHKVPNFNSLTEGVFYQIADGRKCYFKTYLL